MIAAWLLVAILAGEAPASAATPLRVVDDVGTTVLIAGAPARIVCLSPGATEILFALQAGKRIVGVTTLCDYPAAASRIPGVGEFFAPSLEAILAKRPDLVVATGGAQRDLVLRLRQGSIPVLVMYPSGLEGVFRNITLLGRVVGRQETASALVASLRGRVARLTAPLKDLPAASRPKVYFELSGDPIMSFGDTSYAGELIRLAGGTNVAAGTVGDYPRLSAETILAADPDVILLSRCDRAADAVAQVGSRPGWGGLKAVKAGRVYGDLNMDLILRPGPRLVDGLEVLIGKIHPK
ncbi:MAG: cobalamin-binding protein [Candidatus Coatesbacteria bacterium]